MYVITKLLIHIPKATSTHKTTRHRHEQQLDLSITSVQTPGEQPAGLYGYGGQLQASLYDVSDAKDVRHGRPFFAVHDHFTAPVTAKIYYLKRVSSVC